MKTQLSILVKNEGMLARGFIIGAWWTKSKVIVYIDDMNAAPITLKASKTPHILDLTPGPHTIVMRDARAKSKAFGKVVMGAFFGGVTSGASGGSMLAGASIGANMVGTTKHDTIFNVTLKEGDVLKLQAKNTISARVKVKELR